MRWGRKRPGQRQMPVPGAGSNFRENKMRIAAGLIFASTVSLLASGAVWAQTPPAKGAASPPAAAAAQAAPAPAAAAAPASAQPAQAACNTPGALGVGRTVE